MVRVTLIKVTLVMVLWLLQIVSVIVRRVPLVIHARGV